MDTKTLVSDYGYGEVTLSPATRVIYSTLFISQKNSLEHFVKTYNTPELQIAEHIGNHIKILLEPVEVLLDGNKYRR